MIKIIQISHEYFWGFNVTVSLNNFKSFEELSKFIIIELKNFLKKNNLLNLLDKTENLKLHNHMYNSYDELYKTNDKIIYLCGHCN